MPERTASQGGTKTISGRAGRAVVDNTVGRVVVTVTHRGSYWPGVAEGAGWRTRAAEHTGAEPLPPGGPLACLGYRNRSAAAPPAAGGGCSASGSARSPPGCCCPAAACRCCSSAEVDPGARN